MGGLPRRTDYQDGRTIVKRTVQEVGLVQAFGRTIWTIGSLGTSSYLFAAFITAANGS